MPFRTNARHESAEHLVAERLEQLGLLLDYTKPVGCKCVFKGEDGSIFVGTITELHFSHMGELYFAVSNGEIHPISFSKTTDWVFIYKEKPGIKGKLEVCYR